MKYIKAFTYLPIESMIKKNQEEYYTAIQNCNNAGNSTEFIEFMLKMIDNTIDEMNNSKEMKDKSQLLLSENELKVLECIKRNVIVGAKDIIAQTDLSDSTVRRILRKFLQDKKIETTDNNEKSLNKKYKLTKSVNYKAPVIKVTEIKINTSNIELEEGTSL